MISKGEKLLNDEFTKLGIEPKIYHFTNLATLPFRAITVVTEDSEWTKIEVQNTIFHGNFEISEYNRATLMLQKLRKYGLYGVAICDLRDQFNRRYGRIKAKGRLLQHLKKK